MRAPPSLLRLHTLPQFRIAWSAGLIHGHGSYCMTADVAKSWVELLTIKHDHMLHWMESTDDLSIVTESIDAEDLDKTIELVEDVDIFVPEFDDMPNLIATTIEG